MRIIVDTSIWSLALRRTTRKDADPLVIYLKEFILEKRVEMVGPVRQEILSGIKIKKQFETLKQYLKAFPDLPLEKEDYEMAADFYNICRAEGVQGSNTDFLICAVANRRKMAVFTNDKDFQLFSKTVPVHLMNTPG